MDRRHHVGNIGTTSITLVSPRTTTLTGISSTSRDILEEEAPENAFVTIPDGGYGWIVVMACSMLLLLINGYTAAWGVLQTAILAGMSPLHTDVQIITFVGSLYMACMVAFGPIAVRAMDAYQLRTISFIGILLFGGALISASFAIGNLGAFFCIAGVVPGLATCLLYTATNSLPIQWFSSKVGTANGLVKMGGGIGATIIPLIAQSLISRFGVEWTFRILGLMVLVAGLPCVWLLQERTASGRGSLFDWSLLKSVPFMLVASGGAIGVFALFVPPFFLPLFANSIGLPASVGAGLVAGFGAATTIGRLSGGWLCDKIGALNALALAAFTNSLSMWVIWPISDSSGPLFLFAIVNGVANGSFFTCLPTAVAALAPGTAAASISLMVMFWTPGYLVGAPIAGILIQITGAEQSSSIVPYRAAIFYAAGTGLVSTILIVLSRFYLDRKLIKKL